MLRPVITHLLVIEAHLDLCLVPYIMAIVGVAHNLPRQGQPISQPGTSVGFLPG